jgi:hypothetical protein
MEGSVLNLMAVILKLETRTGLYTMLMVTIPCMINQVVLSIEECHY